MMEIIFILFFLYIFFVCSFHSLIMMLLVEFFVLFNFYTICSINSWVVSLMFLFVSVCVSSYGVSLLVSTYRSKGTFYILGFSLF